MFIINVLKCKEIFEKVYVSSDSIEILEMAMKAGAIPIKRPKELCGETPNIAVYRHALKQMNGIKGIVAVQANSPQVKKEIIEEVAKDIKEGYNEVMTCHHDKQIYGSVWGLTKQKILNYKNAYKPKPEKLIVDLSVDIHTEKDYNKAIKYYE